MIFLLDSFGFFWFEILDEFTDHSVWTYYTTYVDVMKEMFANSSAFTLDSNTSTNLLVQRLGNGLKRILLQRKHQSIYISSAVGLQLTIASIIVIPCSNIIDNPKKLSRIKLEFFAISLDHDIN